MIFPSVPSHSSFISSNHSPRQNKKTLGHNPKLYPSVYRTDAAPTASEVLLISPDSRGYPIFRDGLDGQEHQIRRFLLH